ncbi:DUF6980 family protein [Agrobacterium cavarae]|uniref:DUF6980 family protein n=1 Tax=Agrobacterium cavarae TaxID=2528239 RepID=UPI000DDC8391
MQPLGKDHSFCCEAMRQDLTQVCDIHPHREDCADALIGIIDGDYGILIHDGGSSMSQISYCPWCGTKLPTSSD